MSISEISTSQEFFFTPKDKSPCDKCDDKPEVQLNLGMYTKQEFDTIIDIISKYRITRDEKQYVYNFYNRVFNTKKVPGCGKCFVNICKHLRNRYNNEYNT